MATAIPVHEGGDCGLPLRDGLPCRLGDCWVSMYRFTIASGAPPADTTQYEGDQKCSPHNALEST